jgi:adenine-specific DNA-methyltransferase
MASLNFRGKSSCQDYYLNLPNLPPHRLVMDPAVSVPDSLPDSSNPDLDRYPRLEDNLIIQGDNILVLKSLLPTHAAKVKCVYIDPPYNTGNEDWVYNDNLNSPAMQQWLAQDPEAEGGDRHDKWLCMMLPRLSLLREFLCPEGAIFVSIDYRELPYLRLLLDEIFGKENFVAQICWQKKFSRQSDAKFFSDSCDYILVYAKSKAHLHLNLLPRTKQQDQRYKNPDQDPRGVWAADNLVVKAYSSAYDYPITTPQGRIVHPPAGSCWRFSPKKFQSLIDDRRIWFGKSGNNVPRLKRFLAEVQAGLVPTTLWTRDFAGDTQTAVRELRAILGDRKFDSPKPTKLLQLILKIATTQDSLILDGFAGSGTTAQAVLALNQADGGDRKFILIESEDYAATITAERVRRVIQGIPQGKDKTLQAGLPGSFSFWRLGEVI